jgi:hypothetical protein
MNFLAILVRIRDFGSANLPNAAAATNRLAVQLIDIRDKSWNNDSFSRRCGHFFAWCFHFLAILVKTWDFGSANLPNAAAARSRLAAYSTDIRKRITTYLDFLLSLFACCSLFLAIWARIWAFGSEDCPNTAAVRSKLAIYIGDIQVELLTLVNKRLLASSSSSCVQHALFSIFSAELGAFSRIGE